MQFPFEVSYMRAFLANLLLHISIQKLTHSLACAWEPAAAAVGRAGRHRCVSAGAGCRRGSERADAAAGAGREPAAWVVFFLFFSYFLETDMYVGLY